MRALLGLAASLLLPIAAVGAQAPPAGERYLPQDIWEGSRSEFYEDWFGERLRAMNEPVLTGSRNRAPWNRRFRMLIAAERYAWSIRIDFAAGGTAVARGVLLDGPWRDRPLTINGQQVLELDRDAALRIAEAIDASGIAALTPDIAPQRRSRGPDETICIPRAHFVFENVERQSNRVVMRASCDLTPALRTLLDRLRPLLPEAPPERDE